jgi:hypothetical protein
MKEPDWYLTKIVFLSAILANAEIPKTSEEYSPFISESSTAISESTTTASDSVRLKFLETQFKKLKAKLAKTDFEKNSRDETTKINEIREGVEKLNESIGELTYKADTVHREVRRTEQNLQSADNGFSGFKQEYEKHRQSFSDDFAKLTTDTESKLLALEDTGVLKATTRDPAKFWAERKRYHKISFIVWAVILLLIAVAGGKTISNFLDTLTDEDGVLDPRRIGFTLLVGSIVLFSMRIVTRITMSHLHLRTEAEERIVMFESYLSLLSQEQLGDKEDRSLVLNALFRPSTTGLIKEDAVSPSVLDLATRVSQNSK